MAYNGGGFGNEGGSGNVWSSGSRGGGSRGGYSRSNDDDDDNKPRGGGSYRGSYGNNYSNRGGYGFRRQDNNDNRDVEIQHDTIFIQNLPKDITKDAIQDAFSSAGQIKTDDRSGGPKIWIYKDRNTGEANGRATVTYEDNDSASRAISEYNDKHIDSIDAVVQVQLAQRRRNNDRGGFSGGRGYRGGRSNWDSNNSRQGSDGGGNRWGSSNRDFSDNRGGGGGFRGRGGSGGGNFFRNDDDRDDSFRGSRGGGSYRGASRGNSGSSNYSPY